MTSAGSTREKGIDFSRGAGGYRLSGAHRFARVERKMGTTEPWLSEQFGHGARRAGRLNLFHARRGWIDCNRKPWMNLRLFCTYGKTQVKKINLDRYLDFAFFFFFHIIHKFFIYNWEKKLINFLVLKCNTRWVESIKVSSCLWKFLVKLIRLILKVFLLWNFQSTFKTCINSHCMKLASSILTPILIVIVWNSSQARYTDLNSELDESSLNHALQI